MKGDAEIYEKMNANSACLRASGVICCRSAADTAKHKYVTLIFGFGYSCQ
jgi:hypothetical protein